MVLHIQRSRFQINCPILLHCRLSPRCRLMSPTARPQCPLPSETSALWRVSSHPSLLSTAERPLLFSAGLLLLLPAHGPGLWGAQGAVLLLQPCLWGAQGQGAVLLLQPGLWGTQGAVLLLLQPGLWGTQGAVALLPSGLWRAGVQQLGPRGSSARLLYLRLQ